MKAFYKNCHFPKSFNTIVKRFQSTELTLPVINVDKYLKKSEGWQTECKLVAECLHETGVLCIKDPVSHYIYSILLL